MKRDATLVLFGSLILLALTAWILSSLRSVHEAVAAYSPILANVVLVALLVLMAAMLFGMFLLFFRATRVPGAGVEVRAPEDPADAAQAGLVAAGRQLEKVDDEIARRAMARKLEDIKADYAARRYTIVVFGTSSAGKTSVVNALLGTRAGVTSPVVGTTLDGEIHEYAIEGFEDGMLRLVDTPGLAEFGDAGLLREERARSLASEADLLLFVVDQDLRDFEQRPLADLARIGKRALLLFNKADLYAPGDVETLKRKLHERVKGVIDAGDVLVCAADPVPVDVRDSTTAAVIERVAPPQQMDEVGRRIAEILRAEGRTLLANSVLARANSVAREARTAIETTRRDAAAAIVRRFQWTVAGVLFVNPVPGLGALAGAAINYQMITEIGGVFGVALSASDARKLARELADMLVKLGLVSLSTQILGKALKATLVGYVAGGAIEAVAGAYLTRLSGHAFVAYFAQGQDWGDGGMQSAIEKQFSLQRRDAFVRDFIREATRRVLDRGEQR